MNNKLLVFFFIFILIPVKAQVIRIFDSEPNTYHTPSILRSGMIESYSMSISIMVLNLGFQMALQKAPSY